MYSVTSDPQFCNKLHRMQPCVLICEKSKNFSTVTVESLLMSKNRAPMTNPTPLLLPWEPEPDGSTKNHFLGSCNGLICVDHKSSSPDRRRDLILWNPSTREFRSLPRPRCYGDYFWTYVWFGYDESVDDYKLVWLNSGGPCRPFEVFTLKSNTWRSHLSVPRIELHGIKSLVIDFLGFHPKFIGVLSNGAIHWVTYYYPQSRPEIHIVALDLSTEKFRLLEIPQGWLSINTWVGSLFGGCLCLYARYEDEDGCGGMDLWVMKEYGVESS